MRLFDQMVDYYSNRPLPADLNIDQQRLAIADPAEAAFVEGLIVQNWGRNRRGDLNWPSHWSAFPDARSRARAVSDEWEERYVRYFYVFSWHIHSGLVGVAGLPRDVFDIFASQAQQLATEVILNCYSVAGPELHLENAIPEWHRHQYFLQHASGMALVDEKLQTLGEPVRFTYLEAHEREPD